MLNDAKMGWIVAVIALSFTAFSYVLDFGRADQKIAIQEKQLAAVMTQQTQQADIVARMQTQFLDVERRLNSNDRQLQSFGTMDSRLARVEVTVELIARQLGAPLPNRSVP